MPRFAANLTMMFNEWGFLDRFAAAADAGFTAVEFLFPYDHPPEAIAKQLSLHKLKQALFNLPPGDWAAGERGLAALPDRFEALQKAAEKAVAYAQATGARRLHLMSGLADRNDKNAVLAYKKSIGWTAARLAQEEIDLLIEPINSRNMPGYFLNDFDYAVQLIKELALPNLKLQFDIYHRQIIHGDVTMALRQMMPIIGHIQTASVPDRHEPESGELNDGFLFNELDRLGYQGFIGCEYHPAGKTTDGLGWFLKYKNGDAA